MKALLIGSPDRCEEIKSALSRTPVSFGSVHDLGNLRKKAAQKEFGCAVFDYDSVSPYGPDARPDFLRALKGSKIDFIFMTSGHGLSVVREAKAMGAKDFILRPYNDRELNLHFGACFCKKIKIACIGGGTGLFNILSGVKKIPNTLVTSIVGMSDDGGSTGRLRVSFGVLPPGDVRKSLVALSNAPKLMNQVLQYRFKSGGKGFRGHNFGNIFLVALSEIKGSMKEGIKSLSDILNIQGIVVPVTTSDIRLNARFENNTVIAGESRIDLGAGRSPDLHIKDIWHEPKAECNIDAYASVMFSDAVIIGPGDLFTSVITNLIVEDMRKAIAETNAKRIYVCNLMTKPGETADYDAFHHIKDIVRHLKGDHLDYVIISNTRLSSGVLRRYAKKRQFPVNAGSLKRIRKITGAKIILADVGHETDLVRHDSQKIKYAIEKILGRDIRKRDLLRKKDKCPVTYNIQDTACV